MAFARTFGAQATLLSGEIVSIETDLSRGLFAFTLVGLPDKAVEEAKDRVSAAIKNSGFDSPKSKNQKVVISLAPADLKKEGPAFDAPIALSYLLAAEAIAFDPEGKIFAGELSLDGHLRPIRGALPIARAASDAGFTEVFVPRENAAEAACIENIRVYPVGTLTELVEHLTAITPIEPQPHTAFAYTPPETLTSFEDIRGQEHAKRALEIAAAGGHNIALHGPPGTGKTMLAKALCAILPPLSMKNALAATAIHSVAGTLEETLMSHPPFRSPHHTSSYVSLVGGGATPRPGEITLAHMGVLFLDEFPEFERRVIDALRQPLEDRVIHVARAKGSVAFPADFILVAAMNPCPCGNFGSAKSCVCAPIALSKYQKKVSGPIADRIDIWVEVPHVPHELLKGVGSEKKETESIRSKVRDAREVQKARYQTLGLSIETNATLYPKILSRALGLTQEGERVIQDAATRLDLSPRAYHRMLKVARTIADLEHSLDVERDHVLEALQYRPKKGMVGNVA